MVISKIILDFRAECAKMAKKVENCVVKMFSRVEIFTTKRYVLLIQSALNSLDSILSIPHLLAGETCSDKEILTFAGVLPSNLLTKTWTVGFTEILRLKT